MERESESVRATVKTRGTKYVSFVRPRSDYIPTHCVLNGTHTSQNVRNNSLRRLMKSYIREINH